VPGTEPSITGVKIGIPQSFYFDSVDADVDAAVRAVARNAEAMGAYVIPVAVPDIAALNAVGRVILLAEASALMEPYLKERRADIGEDVLALLDQGRLLPATDYVNAQRLRRMFQGRFAEIWETVDVLLTPTTPITAPRIGETTAAVNGGQEDIRLASTRLVRGINVLGLPAISIPCGQDSRGLPIGAQIIGQPFAEAAVLRVAQALMPGEAPAPQL
jgi:aspartyl-tRNA(Asn)/glutamyl-tRNA(Gln) amidotransferase subunit A